MLTVTSKIQYDQARKEKNLLEFQQILNTNKLDRITKQIASYKEDAKAAGVTDAVLKDDVQYKAMVAEQTTYDTINDNIGTQLEALNQEMDSFLKLEQSGIQSATTFWCFGG